VRSCPGLLDVVCNSQYPALTAGAPYNQTVLLDCLTTAGYAPPPGVDCGLVEDSCWVTPQATSSTFFRCVPDYNITSASNTACIFPANVTDASDPRCVLAQTDTGTTIQRPAKPNFLFDQMNTARQLWGRWFGDLQRAWWVVLVCGVVLAVVLGFAFTLLMKACTGCMVWTTIVLVVLAFAALDIFFYYKGGLISWDLVPDDVEARLKSIIPRITLPDIGINTNDLSQAASALVPDGFISVRVRQGGEGREGGGVCAAWRHEAVRVQRRQAAHRFPLVSRPRVTPTRPLAPAPRARSPRWTSSRRTASWRTSSPPS
jgi:hypothetical protein